MEERQVYANAVESGKLSARLVVLRALEPVREFRLKCISGLLFQNHRGALRTPVVPETRSCVDCYRHPSQRPAGRWAEKLHK
jgi:hypothetical protein